MAHRILGLDIGSAEVRVAIVDKSLRQLALVGYDSEPVRELRDADADAAVKGPLSPERQAAVRRLLARHQRPDDMVAVALPARLALHRALQFPFKDDKAIADAVGFELENHIPTPISDLVVDFVRTGEKDGQVEVLAIAADRATVVGWLDTYKHLGIDARHLGLQSLAYARLVARLPAARDGVTLWVDIGAHGSEVAVIRDGRTQFIRSLGTGGDTIADLYAQLVQSDLSPSQLWRQHAVLLPPESIDSPRERALAEATAEALQPLLRELRQTLSAWLRKGRRAPDRIVLAGGPAAQAGLAEFVARVFDLPTTTVGLDAWPEARIADARRAGDHGALAVALALSAADVEIDHDVDFRQGDLAYEGDYKVLRQRLPHLVAFFVIALCLVAVRSSLHFRALVIEQEQQVATLQALSKQLTGKASTDFEAVSTELGRTPAVDIAGLYPDISAFKALEDVSNILDKVTEPPDYKPPGGPEEPPVPQVPGPDLAARPGDGSRPQPPAAVAPTLHPPAEPPTFRGLPDMGGAPPTERMPPPSPTAVNPLVGAMPAGSAVGGAAPASTAGGSDERDGDLAPKPPGTGGHQLELGAVVISSGHGTLRGDADTQDALLALQQAIDAHRCFGKVKSSSDRITFERHRDWFKFTLEFEIACPAEEAAAKGSAAGAAGDDKGGAKGGAAKKGDDDDDQ